jgi:hypothetical protein
MHSYKHLECVVVSFLENSLILLFRVTVSHVDQIKSWVSLILIKEANNYNKVYSLGSLSSACDICMQTTGECSWWCKTSVSQSRWIFLEQVFSFRISMQVSWYWQCELGNCILTTGQLYCYRWLMKKKASVNEGYLRYTWFRALQYFSRAALSVLSTQVFFSDYSELTIRLQFLCLNLI